MNTKTIKSFIEDQPSLYWFLGASTSNSSQDFAAFSSILEYIQSKEELSFPYKITLVRTSTPKIEIIELSKFVREGDAIFTACAGSTNSEIFLDQLNQSEPNKLKSIKHLMFHHYSERLFSKYPDRFKIAFLPKYRDNDILENQLKHGRPLASTVSTIVFDDSAMLNSSKSINPRVPYLLQPNCVRVANTMTVHELDNIKLVDTNKMVHSINKIVTDPEGRCLFQHTLIHAILHSLANTTKEESFIDSISLLLKDHSMKIIEKYQRIKK